MRTCGDGTSPEWAFSEAVIGLLRDSEEVKRLKVRLEKKYGEGRALSILAARLGRSLYHMLRKSAMVNRCAAASGVRDERDGPETSTINKSRRCFRSVGLSQSAYRSRLQTAVSGFGQKPRS